MSKHHAQRFQKRIAQNRNSFFSDLLDLQTVAITSRALLPARVTRDVRSSCDSRRTRLICSRSRRAITFARFKSSSPLCPPLMFQVRDPEGKLARVSLNLTREPRRQSLKRARERKEWMYVRIRPLGLVRVEGCSALSLITFFLEVLAFDVSILDEDYASNSTGRTANVSNRRIRDRVDAR